MTDTREPDDIARIWFHRAEVIQDDDFDRFISMWVSFNALYGQFHTNERSERDAIDTFVTSNIANKQCLGNALSSSSALYFRNRMVRIHRGKYPDTSHYMGILNDASLDAQEHVRAVLQIIYSVRCNLFHGRKLYTDESERIVVRHAASVLEKLLRAYRGGVWGTRARHAAVQK
jgi:hypothetical protein